MRTPLIEWRCDCDALTHAPADAHPYCVVCFEPMKPSPPERNTALRTAILEGEDAATDAMMRANRGVCVA